MCICVNCLWVDRCKAYHAVERQHEVEHLTHNPDFKPKNPTIHINVIKLSKESTGVEWDVQACESFKEDNGRWLRLRPNQPLPS